MKHRRCTTLSSQPACTVYRGTRCEIPACSGSRRLSHPIPNRRQTFPNLGPRTPPAYEKTHVYIHSCNDNDRGWSTTFMADHTKHLSPLLKQPALVLPNICLNSTLNPELRYKTSSQHIPVSTCNLYEPHATLAFSVPLRDFPLLDKGGQQRKSPSRAGANCACRARKKQRRRLVQQASLFTLLTHGALI